MDDRLGLELSGVYSKYSNSYINTETDSDSTDNSYMDFDSYLKLLVSQMQNQDFNDPMSDAEVLNQMATYSMLDGIKSMTQQSNISYSTSLVGKIVTVSDNGNYYTGIVDSVTVSNGKPSLMIGGNAYSSSTVTDIVDTDIYGALYNNWMGKTVKSINAESEGAVTGKVTEVLFYGGSGYAVINGQNVVPIEALEIVNGTDSSDETDENGTDAVEGTNTETSEVTEAAVMQSYQARSQSLVDTFMKELDEVSGTSAVSEASETTNITEEYVTRIAELEVPDYHAGMYVSADTIESAALTNVDNTYSSGTLTRTDAEEVNTVKETVNAVRTENTSGVTLKGVTTEAGVSTSECVPHRISVEKYPEEAALADMLGTRMYDIRYINNHAVTSRIKTDEIIGYTKSGRAITEIGYSGKGQLGEVVTFADGTQRVEILLSRGKSAWLYTSGNLTLDELCSENAAPGSLKDITPFESAIREYAREYTAAEQAELDAFKSWVLSR
ncbi:MAG: hypothetical protein J6C96_11275 [Oscillospiraceae bacterium]|nr:hypothetical protein [Oscillospiraceae bacterium]